VTEDIGNDEELSDLARYLDDNFLNKQDQALINNIKELSQYEHRRP
jgi:hypothetical protein